MFEEDDEDWSELVAARLEVVTRRIAKAAHKVDRAADSVTLLPVTKTLPAKRLVPVVELGYKALGENRVQELKEKAQELEGLGVSWEMIGRMQTNKAGQVARVADVVQSVDSVRLARSLDRGAHAAGRKLAVLIQANTSGEESKTGFDPLEVPEALDHILGLEHLEVRGLMTMAPFGASDYVVRSTFAALRELRTKLRETYGPSLPLPVLSMGMSEDFETAIEEGSTLVRIGSAIFGPRS